MTGKYLTFVSARGGGGGRGGVLVNGQHLLHSLLTPPLPPTHTHTHTHSATVMRKAARLVCVCVPHHSGGATVAPPGRHTGRGHLEGRVPFHSQLCPASPFVLWTLGRPWDTCPTWSRANSLTSPVTTCIARLSSPVHWMFFVLSVASDLC